MLGGDLNEATQTVVLTGKVFSKVFAQLKDGSEAQEG